MTGNLPENQLRRPAPNSKSSGLVRLDASARSVVAWCTGCPSWRRLAGSTSAGHALAADHAELVHGNAQAAKEHRRRARDTQNGGGNLTS